MKANADIIAALCVLLIAGSVSVGIYTRLFDERSGIHLTFPGTDDGGSRFGVRYEGRCVGTVTTRVKRDRLTELHAESTLRLVHSGKQDEVHAAILAYSNPLDQVFRSEIEITYGGAKVALASENVNPISLSLSFSSPGFSYSRRFTLPGPIMLERDRSGHIELSYAHAGALDLAPLRGLAPQLPRSNAPALDESAFAECEKDASAIDVSSLNADLQQWVGRMQRVLPLLNRGTQ